MIVAIWAAALITVFVAFRSSDLLKLPSLLGNLGGGPLVGSEIVASVIGTVCALLIAFSWFGVGSLVLRAINEPGGQKPLSFVMAESIAVGAAVWSLVFIFLGLFNLYKPAVAVVAALIGIASGVYGAMGLRNVKRESGDRGLIGNIAFVMIAVVLLTTFIASLAPPIAKDTLLYHFSVPKAFIAQGSNAFIDGNIASYLALGTEMHVVWAMLLGGLFSPPAGEAAAGATVFMFFPVLLRGIYGWATGLGISRTTSIVAALTVAAIPTAFHVASSGYIDIALAVYVVLAVAALGRWWHEPSTGSVILIGVFLGAALSIKLTTVFVMAAFALIIFLRGRAGSQAASLRGDESGGHEGNVQRPDTQAGSLRSDAVGTLVLSGLGALLLAGIIASPWYLRNWVATGSPVFPFYMSIWEGKAAGWDVERSNLFQMMNSQYGGAEIDKTNYLMAPLRVSLAAQPENPGLYDGVLGAAFLVGLPLLLWAIWRRNVGIEITIAAGVAGIVSLFWLFSSPQLRYLLPIVPLLAVGIAAAIDSLTDETVGNAWKYSLVGASAAAMLTGFAWFCQKAPLRVVLGGETRDEYLTRNLDYYRYYKHLNTEAPPDAKVWLINMRRDTYHIDRPVVSDYLFEDWTLRDMAWSARNAPELKAMAASLGIQYILTRDDFLLDPQKSTLIDDRKAAESQTRIQMVRELVRDPQRTVMSDEKFSLVKIY